MVESRSLLSDPRVIAGSTLVVDSVDPDHLAAFVAEQPEHRVGRYFERLLLYWFVHVRKLDDVRHAVVIRDHERTIGEIDFLYRDERGLLVHCEAAVKFFLHHPNRGRSDYPGPNRSDDFERKVAKLFGRQLHLSVRHHPEVDERRAFVKGRLFYHPDIDAPIRTPDRLAADHLRGVWVRGSEVDQLGDLAPNALFVPKPWWLAPIQGSESTPMTTIRGRLEDHFRGAGHPVMVSLRDEDNVETGRAFVVSDGWGSG